MRRVILLVFAIIMFSQLASALGEFKFDFAAKVGGPGNYTKHWSSTYPPDPKADIIIYSEADNVNYKRMSALSFLYVVYDPFDNVVAVQKLDSFKMSYEPSVVYYTLHPQPDWIEGNYKVRIIIYDRIDREAYDDNITKDPFGIGNDPDTYKTFYETGANAQNMGVLFNRGIPVAQAVLNFKIDKSASLYPPDRFLLHDVRFIDNNTERILGEKLKIEVKIDNNYKDDGTVKLAMLVDNSLVSTQDITVKGLSTSTVLFDAKAGKTGTYKLHFGVDTPDMKYRNAELTFSIKNETDAAKLEEPQISITGMNVNKEFVPVGANVTVSVTAINNGKSGKKIITVYSNRVPVGSSELSIQYLEEKTIDIPISLETMGINKITVSDAPQLFRNVFVQEGGAGTQDNPILSRLKDSPLKVSVVIVFIVFAGTLYYVRKKLKEEDSPAGIPAQATTDIPGKNRLSDLKMKLTNKVKNMVKRKTRP